MSPWPVRFGVVLWFGGTGCAQVAPRPEYIELSRDLPATAHRPPPRARLGDPMAASLNPEPTPPGLEGSQPVDIYIRRALAANRGVQAARFNVLAMRDRIPQAVALADPTVQNTIYPFPSYALQTASGYLPYGLLIQQQFPWFGTLQLRGQVADREARVALTELATVELTVVERVKRSYYELSYNQRAERILLDNRALAEEFVENTRSRFESGLTTQQDILRAEVAVDEVNNDLIRIQQGRAEARAMLARQLHVSPEADLRALPDVEVADVPAQVDRLYRLAAASRPELKGRLETIARDRAQVALARNRYKPDISLGLAYQTVSLANSVARNANGHDNIGLFVGFNLPIYRSKLDAAVREAEFRAVADARRYDDLRDQTYEEVKDLFVQAQALRETIDLFRGSILPKSEQALDVARNDYTTGEQDFVSLLTVWQQVLRVELQLARFESDLGKTLASLERVVGCGLNANPPGSSPPLDAEGDAPPPPPEADTGPFASPDLLEPPASSSDFPQTVGRSS